MEKRRSKRLPLTLELSISTLFKQKNEIIPDLNVKIEVKNVSKTGLGFNCNQKLPLGYYFDARIHLGNNKSFSSVIKIIRSEQTEEGFFYGCEFIGLAEILSSKIDLYEEELDKSGE